MLEIVAYSIFALLFFLMPIKINISVYAFLIPFQFMSVNLAGVNLTLSEILLLCVLIQTFHVNALVESDGKTIQYERDLTFLILAILFVIGNLFLVLTHLQIGNFIEFLQRMFYVFGSLSVGRFCYRKGFVHLIFKSYLYGAGVFSFMRIGYMIISDASLIESHKNNSGLVFAIAFAVSLGLSNDKKMPSIIPLWFAFSTILTLSRSATISVVVVLLWYLVIKRDLSILIKWIFSLSFVMSISWFSFFTSDNVEYLKFWNRDEAGRFDYQIEARRSINQRALEWIIENPIFGYGYGGQNGFGVWSTHNILTQSALEGGLLLLVPTLCLLLITFARLWKLKKVDSIGLIGFYVWLATMFHAFADSYWTRGRVTFSWLIFGILLQGMTRLRDKHLQLDR